MSFFETMAALELASQLNKRQSAQPREYSEAEQTAQSYAALPVFVIMTLPLAFLLAVGWEWRKKRWAFLLGMSVVFAIDEVISRHYISGLWSLLGANVIFGVEYWLYVFHAWIHRLITRGIEEKRPLRIGAGAYIVMAAAFYTFLIVFKAFVDVVVDKQIMAIILAAVLGLTAITILRAWFAIRVNKGKKAVPLYVSVLFISAALTSVFWIGLLRFFINHMR